MPAYRSSDEAEIREAVVRHLRLNYPRARIMHEVNASSFGNRIDVLAVDLERIIAVEIKSRKDKLDRLPDQIKAMRGVTHEVFAALHEKFLTTHDRYGFNTPDAARGAVVWAWPIEKRKGHVECGARWNARGPWSKTRLGLPPSAIDMLWRDELHEICRQLGVSGASKLNMSAAIDYIRWRMTGKEITRAICATLRARKCVEADSPIAALTTEAAE